MARHQVWPYRRRDEMIAYCVGRGFSRAEIARRTKAPINRIRRVRRRVRAEDRAVALSREPARMSYSFPVPEEPTEDLVAVEEPTEALAVEKPAVEELAEDLEDLAAEWARTFT